MKTLFIRLSVLLFAIVLFYTACKKSGNSPVSDNQKINNEAISGQIALNLYKSLTGAYGGSSINDGIKAPKSMSLSTKGLTLNSINTLCGYIIDTTYNTKLTAGDTAKTFMGNFKFVYTCDNNNVDGYTLHDSLNNVESGALFNNNYIVSQNYAVKALDTTYKLVSMDGTILAAINAKVLSAAGASTGYHNLNSLYTLAGVQVNISSGIADVTTGTATFTTTTNDLNANTPTTGSIVNYTGTITFLGNHTATLVIQIGSNPSASYTVNLLTGAVSAV